MRLLFEMDQRDYGECTKRFVRNSARAVIIRGGKVAMVRSRKYEYYKFPGGGIESGEDPIDAVIRETREETGLIVIPESLREYGFVHRVQKSTVDPEERFVQDNFYYLCEAEENAGKQNLDDYESDEGYSPVFVFPEEAIRVNRLPNHGPTDRIMLEREARVLERLKEDGYFDRTEAGGKI